MAENNKLKKENDRLKRELDAIKVRGLLESSKGGGVR
jgi:hypothetical protein